MTLEFNFKHSSKYIFYLIGFDFFLFLIKYNNIL